MTRFTEVPPLGTVVQLAGRTVRMPSTERMETLREEAIPFYPWYSLCPIGGDIITVETRPGEMFWVERADASHSFDRWICQVRQITAIDEAGVLTFGFHLEWTIMLPGVQGVIPKDECMLSQVEIIGQTKTVQRLTAPL